MAANRVGLPKPYVTMSERDWQTQFLALARSLGWRAMHVRTSRDRKGHTTATTVRGWVDLTIWSERQQRVCFVELKSARGHVEPDQEALHASLRAAGQEVYVWRPSDFDEAVRTLRGAPESTPGGPDDGG
jgi:hypothetical protein